MNQHDRWHARATRVLDAFAAVVLLVLLSPVLVVAVLAVLVTMGAPVLFRDERSGRDGRLFELLKFRTMRALRAGETIPESDSDRITRVGGVLRRTSIDELPSLVNVLRGDMSFVGPRPLPVRYLDRYTPRQRRRLEVRPGITGWAQVNGRNSLGWEEKLELDVWYVDHASMNLDARIIAMTVRQLFRRGDIGHGDDATMPEFGGATGAGVADAGEDARRRR